MGKREEITDLISDTGIRELRVGTMLRFDYEGSKTAIRITRKDTKNMRIWGEHIAPVPVEAAMTHYGHNIDVTQTPVYCSDCEVPVSETANQKGEDRFNLREDIKNAQQKTTSPKRQKGHGRGKTS